MYYWGQPKTVFIGGGLYIEVHLYTNGSIGTAKNGLYGQVVFIYRWSLRQVPLYWVIIALLPFSPVGEFKTVNTFLEL